MKDIKFSEVVTRVKKVNDNLYKKGLSLSEIDEFWTRIIDLIPAIANAEKIGKTIKVCKGCGRTNLEPITGKAMACCPDMNYVHIATD